MIKWEFCSHDSEVCWGCAICTTTGLDCYLLSDIWDGTYLTQKSPPLSSGDHLGRGETAANNVPSLTLWNLPTLNIRTVWRVTRLVSIKVSSHFILYQNLDERTKQKTSCNSILIQIKQQLSNCWTQNSLEIYAVSCIPEMEEVIHPVGSHEEKAMQGDDHLHNQISLERCKNHLHSKETTDSFGVGIWPGDPSRHLLLLDWTASLAPCGLTLHGSNPGSRCWWRRLWWQR